MLFGVVVVLDLIVAVLSKIEGTPGKIALRADHKYLLVTGGVQNVPQAGDAGEEALLGRHTAVGHIGDAAFQRQAGGLGKEGAHRPGCTGHDIAAVDAAAVAGEALVFQGQRGQFRDDVGLSKPAAAGIIGVGSLHGFKINVHKVALFLGELQIHTSGVHIVFLDKRGVSALVLQVGSHVQAVPGKGSDEGIADSRRGHQDQPRLAA